MLSYDCGLLGCAAYASCAVCNAQLCILCCCVVCNCVENLLSSLNLILLADVWLFLFFVFFFLFNLLHFRIQWGIFNAFYWPIKVLNFFKIKKKNIFYTSGDIFLFGGFRRLHRLHQLHHLLSWCWILERIGSVGPLEQQSLQCNS